ncbi:MAG: flagellar filament capping protein FliD [Lachnospiraceae bacterium]|nr:flagellar filament capping protein FliD [Lachnospiraceae bacterium]
MPIRITGMNSGLDTEAIITELSKAQKTKVDKVKKEQTAYEWKRDAWKDLNSKIYKLFNTTVNNLRMESNFAKKTTDVSDSSVAEVVTGGNAMYTAQDLEVERLATSGYLTGGELADTTKKTTKLSELGITVGEKITVKSGSKQTEIEITDSMTIESFVNALKGAGLEANYDANYRRIHIAAKDSGSANDFELSSTGNALDTLKISDATAANRIKGENARLTLNNVAYESDSNTFEINGLTITAKAAGTATMTTRQDTDGIYDMIKNFFKEYNGLINEMDKLYNAESTKGYEPLTDEEKAELSDDEVKKWETKIKDSILRRDSNLSSISTAMKNIMLQGATVNGKQMYLSDFGIETLGYFSAEKNEKNAYHIDGDADDAAVSAKEDKLKAAIASDPDSVISFFSQLGQNLYTEMNNQSRSIDGVRSFGSFYDDKRMLEEYNSFASKIKKQEAKLTAFQDRWYNKFTAMETALARLQSNQNAVSGLFGGM